MGKRANEIMSAMSLKKNKEYPDATPSVLLALSKARKECAAAAESLASQVGDADEEMMTSMCLRNVAMITPALNSSYYVRKEVLGWDCRV